MILLLFHMSDCKCSTDSIAIDTGKVRDCPLYTKLHITTKKVSMLFKRIKEKRLDTLVKLYLKIVILPFTYLCSFIFYFFVTKTCLLCEKQKQTAETSEFLLTEEWLLNKYSLLSTKMHDVVLDLLAVVTLNDFVAVFLKYPFFTSCKNVSLLTVFTIWHSQRIQTIILL